jgi:hypothetical protein
LDEEKPPWLTPSRLFALLQILAVNGVTLYGVYVLGWSWGTALALYWCETLLGTVFIGLRMAVHRRLTRKRGYYRSQLGVKMNDEPFKSFLAEFLTGSLVFNLAHGLFLFFVLHMLASQGEAGAAVHLSSLKKGAAAMAVIVAGTFAVDLQTLRERPFAWIRVLALRSMGRTIVVHLAIVFGMAGMMFFNQKAAPFVVFAALKILYELGGLSSGVTPAEAPEWAVRIASLAPKGGEGFREKYRKDRRKEDGLLDQDEQEMKEKRRR